MSTLGWQNNDSGHVAEEPIGGRTCNNCGWSGNIDHRCEGCTFINKNWRPKRQTAQSPQDPITAAIQALSEITAKHLDEASMQTLTQLYFWTAKHHGAIFVKTVGRMDNQERKQ